MAEGKRIRVTLRWLQILDNLEPAYDEEGEFRFHSRVTSRNGDIVDERQFPETGYYSIRDHPAWNKLNKLDKVLFEGEVQDHLVVELNGEEIDLLSANDHLEAYRREFEGPVESWAGRYEPGDEGGKETDPENMSNWRIGYDIEML
ncbi:MAG TPA: hypothetical protein VJ957_03990 [Longimicrobiales bacterium]|nr:hypothetical protein [Longimicrobiales bacterium]